MRQIDGTVNDDGGTESSRLFVDVRDGEAKDQSEKSVFQIARAMRKRKNDRRDADRHERTELGVAPTSNGKNCALAKVLNQQLEEGGFRVTDKHDIDENEQKRHLWQLRIKPYKVSRKGKQGHSSDDNQARQ